MNIKTIEEKAKAYDEKLDMARHIYADPSVKDEDKYYIEVIFPELKESEDERIMEKVIATIHLYYGEPLEDEAKEMIAWLEKQKVLTTEEDLQGKEDVLWCIKQAKKHAKDENEMGTCWFAEKWLEQGGQKPNYCHHEVDLSNCSEEYRKAYYDGWNNCNQQHAQLEAEQKPADKVEPKFKVGDWVVRNGEKLQISGIDFMLDGTFLYWFTKGTWLSSKKMENAMLWTIQDAKDGDVLFIGIDSSTCIFKKLEGNLLYSYIISDGKLFVEDSHYYYETSDNVHPATKEQREQLEKAMADAGYTFDFDKKELKKVEQKPVNRLKITAGNWYVCDMEVWNENMITAFHRGEVYYCPKDGYIDVNGMLCEVGTLDVFRLATKEEIPQQKQEWNEEDEKMLNTVIHNLRYPGVNYYKKPIEENVKWLKSLKDRVQSKQEWSDVDKDILFRTIDNLKFLKDTISTDSKYAVNIIDIEREITWLKSLRHQNRWKPSDEQIAIDNIK